MLDLAKLFKIENKNENIHKIAYPSSYPADETNRRCPNIFKAKDHLNFSKLSLEEKFLIINWCKSNF